MIRLITALILIVGQHGFAQELHEEISQLYNFSPAKLSRDEQDKKIPLMDEFWKKVKSDTGKYLPELRKELQMDGNPAFFYYDGGQLLLSSSKSLSDKKIVLESVLKSDLKDIDRQNYIATLNYLAKANLNTTEAALRILDDKEFRFFIPQHAFHFNQSYCLTYALLPAQPALYVNEVIKRFKDETDTGTKKSIVTLLWFANSCTGNEFLVALASDKTVNKEISSYARDLLKRKYKKEEYYEALDDMSSEELLIAQKRATNRMSDEAIHELDYITKLLRQKSCRQD